MTMTISVIGVGYLGAVHAASMAELGHDVIGLDVDARRIEMLNQGRPPFHEPGFEETLRRGLDAGRLRFTADPEEIAGADVHFLALGTPQLPDGLGADLTALHAAVDALLAVLPRRQGRQTLVVGKSTVPVGTARDLAERLEAVPGVHLAWNPEFLREGFAVRDTLEPDRIVYGTRAPDGTGAPDDPAAAMLDAVYARILAQDVPRLVMGLEAAELVKVSANAFLATKISFINAIAELCEATGADVADIARAIGMDERIGPTFLRAGVGFGGGCLPKDVRAFIASAEELGVGQALGFLREVDAVNERRRDRAAELAQEMLGGQLDGRRITILGAAFKPDSDDVRDSPALAVAERLRRAGADVVVTDPQALPTAAVRLEGLVTEPCLERALAGAELALLLTEWREYRDLDPATTGGAMAARRMVDGRGVLDLPAWRAAGWQMRALGRP